MKRLELEPGEYEIPLPDADGCKDCGGSCVIELNIDRSGYSVCNEWKHWPGCPQGGDDAN